jgi:transposase-like protein
LEYDNNLSERLLRQCKRKMKAMVTFRSPDSASDYCDVLSMIKTADQQGINIYSMMKKGFSESL